MLVSMQNYFVYPNRFSLGTLVWEKSYFRVKWVKYISCQSKDS